jgi:hypothetical protein
MQDAGDFVSQQGPEELVEIRVCRAWHRTVRRTSQRRAGPTSCTGALRGAGLARLRVAATLQD